MGVAVPPQVADGLWVYFQLLVKWNVKINLTGLHLIDLAPEGFDRLFIEPVIAAAHVSGAQSMIDIGSGGGSPALPLAVAAGMRRLAMVESKTRKSVFLREAARALGLSNVSVITARHEALAADPDLYETFDILTIRAVRVGPLELSTLQTLVRPGGKLLLFRSAAEPAPQVPPTLAAAQIYPLNLSGSSELAVLQKLVDVPRETARRME
jgi:16S rRNA (guanine527-N7)-methyltransferase